MTMVCLVFGSYPSFRCISGESCTIRVTSSACHFGAYVQRFKDGEGLVCTVRYLHLFGTRAFGGRSLITAGCVLPLLGSSFCCVVVVSVGLFLLFFSALRSVAPELVVMQPTPPNVA